MAEEKNKRVSKELPHNIEAEEALLGALIKDDEVAQDSMPLLAVEDFYSETHRIIFSAMTGIYVSNKPIDLVTLSDELALKDMLEKVGGIDYLSLLVRQIVSTANYKEYLDIVKRDSLKRRLIRSSTNIIENCYSNQNDIDDLTYAEGEIFNLSKEQRRNFPSLMSESLNAVVDKFNIIGSDKNAFRGLPCGIATLDDKINGLGRSDLILIAARPSEGKTSLVMNFVENAAVIGGATCLVFSLEMSKTQIAQRMLCCAARVQSTVAMQGGLLMDEWERLYRAKSILSKAKIFVDDTSSVTPQDILSKCRRLKSREGALDLIVIDYLQLMSSGIKKLEGNRQGEISEISRKLKLIAREMNCPLIALSQLSRSVESRKPPKPMLSDLRDSGAIEQDADIVLFIYNPEKNVASDSDKPTVTGVGKSGPRQLIIAKNRNGEICDVDVMWESEYVRFSDKGTVGSSPTIRVAGNDKETQEEMPTIATDDDLKDVMLSEEYSALSDQLFSDEEYE